MKQQATKLVGGLKNNPLTAPMPRAIKKKSEQPQLAMTNIVVCKDRVREVTKRVGGKNGLSATTAENQ